MKDRIKKLITKTVEVSTKWIKEKDGILQFVDPIDKVEISAHYGATHEAVALIIYGNETNDKNVLKLGKELLNNVFARWDSNKDLLEFHNDFNNFALCVLDAYSKEYHETIVKIVCETPDSNHDTVNWLPMRWYVNKCRYKWTGERKYNDLCTICKNKIKEATYEDGFIDDRLPKGISFNLQYDIATVAVLQFLRVMGEDIDISKETGALLNAVCPDGDINYLGRGTNQIFAWGLWIYLLSSSSQKELERGLGYLENRLSIMLDNNNIMLNDYPGKEKYMWWDYHYCSVYTAHFLFWMIMAWKDYDKKSIDAVLFKHGNSGIHIYKTDKYFISLFDGRREYLSETGCVIAAIWTKKYGVICKGTFGPWLGTFGTKYSQPFDVFQNYTGLYRITLPKWRNNKIIKRFFRRSFNSKSLEIHPVFAKVSIDFEDETRLKLRFLNNQNEAVFFNAAVMPENIQPHVQDSDGNEIPVVMVGKNRNQYGWTCLYNSCVKKNKEWVLIF